MEFELTTVRSRSEQRSRVGCLTNSGAVVIQVFNSPAKRVAENNLLSEEPG